MDYEVNAIRADEYLKRQQAELALLRKLEKAARDVVDDLVAASTTYERRLVQALANLDALRNGAKS